MQSKIYARPSGISKEKSDDVKNCPECKYLFEERAAIHQFDGKATRQDAERLAESERCHEHKQKPEQRELI